MALLTPSQAADPPHSCSTTTPMLHLSPPPTEIPAAQLQPRHGLKGLPPAPAPIHPAAHTALLKGKDDCSPPLIHTAPQSLGNLQAPKPCAGEVGEPAQGTQLSQPYPMTAGSCMSSQTWEPGLPQQ